MENDRETRIRQRAYQLWLDGGSPEGKQEDHWAQAEREIDNGDPEIGSSLPQPCRNARSRTDMLTRSRKFGSRGCGFSLGCSWIA